MGLVLDTSGLAAALRQKLEVTPREMPEVLNKAGRNVALRAVQFSASVAPADISAELQRVVSHQIAGRNGRRLKRPRANVKPTTLGRAIVAARMRRRGENPAALGSAGIEAAVARMVNARMRSASYLKSGYLPAAEVFGARVGGVPLFQEHGSGKIATPDDLFAHLVNTVPVEWANGAVAYEAALRALQAAVDFVEADVLQYVDEKLRKLGFG